MLFRSTWVYCGHESQVKAVGDYHTLHIGRQPMVMVRDRDQSIRVLYNRCPHRGVQLCGTHSGNTGSGFVCPYHAWSFHLNGQVRAIPLAKGYDGTRLKLDDPQASMVPAARVDSYRGFVFASLSAEGPSLVEFLGEAKVAFDDMCDRSPLGEVEVVFGLWAMLLIVLMFALDGAPVALQYIDTRNFTEPMFVFAIMVVAGTRPILQLCSQLVHQLASRTPLPTAMVNYFLLLSVVPLLGSLITEPAAMTSWSYSSG